MKELIEIILARHERQLTGRAALDAQLEQIRRYIDPFLPPFTSAPMAGEDLPKCCDDTAISAADNYVQAIHRAITPSGLDWVQFEPEDPTLKEDWEERQRQTTAERIIQHGLDNSNFQAQMNIFWRQYGNAGTAFIHVDDFNNTGNFLFSAFSSVGVSFWENADGIIDSICREVRMTARQVGQNAQSKGWKIEGTKAAASLANNKPDEEHVVLHYIGANDDIVPMRSQSAKYVSLFIDKDSKTAMNADGTGKRWEGYEEFPVLAGRQIRVMGDPLGRSRAFSILERVKELNRICWYWDKGILTSILGFYKDREDNYKRKTGDPKKINAGDTLYFDDPSIHEEAHTPANYGLAWQEILNRKEEIKEHFFWSDINMRKEKYNMTTLELMQAQTQLAGLLSQQVLSGNNEVIVPMMERCLAIKMRSGEIEWPRRIAA
jgi:hypothetical protein